MYRSNTRLGLWLCFLLPLATFQTSSDWAMKILSISTSAQALNFALSSLLPLKNITQLFYTPSSMINTMMNYEHLGSLVTLLCVLSFMLTSFLETTVIALAFVGFSLILPQFFNTFKGTFSYGEGCLVLQCMTFYASKSLLNFVNDIHDPTTIEGSFSIIANVGLTSLFVLCACSYVPLFAFINSSTTFYATGASLLCGVSLPFLWWRLKRNPLFWLQEYVFGSTSLIYLLLFWVLCTLFSIRLVTQQSVKAGTATRKYFHAIVVIVFTSGILIDVNFLYLASVVSFCIMVLLEHMRFQGIEPVASLLNQSFELFQDEKDQGDLILTNIYLLSGVSLPLWLSQSLASADRLPLLSGVLSIGIGDSFASIVGSKWGRIKIFGGPKTLEGLCASIVSQVAFIHFLYICQFVPPIRCQTVAWIMIVSCVEAVTTQVDNIVLPFLMFILMNLPLNVVEQ